MLSRFTVLCLVFCLFSLSCADLINVCQMYQLFSNAQQVQGGVLPCLLLFEPILCTPDAGYVRCISCLAMLSRFRVVFCLVFRFCRAGAASSLLKWPN